MGIVVRRYEPDSEYDVESLEKLNAEPWMLKHLELNPSYLGWGPGDDCMGGKGDGWTSALEFASWKEFGLELDDLNECVHFYFELNRDSNKCIACSGTGCSPAAKRYGDEWYGNAPFDPMAYGANPLTLDHPGVQERARLNVERGPGYYGTGVRAISREARRLFELWRSMWSHNLIQADVDALVKAERLWDLTRRPRTPVQEAAVAAKVAAGENSWLPGNNGYTPTADEVNAWSLGGMAHDAINQWVCVRARCERAGEVVECSECGGAGYIYIAPAAHLDLVLWMLHPRKGASRGMTISNLSRDDAASARAWLRKAADRNAERFAKLATL